MTLYSFLFGVDTCRVKTFFVGDHSCSTYAKFPRIYYSLPPYTHMYIRRRLKNVSFFGIFCVRSKWMIPSGLCPLTPSFGSELILKTFNFANMLLYLLVHFFPGSFWFLISTAVMVFFSKIVDWFLFKK